MPAPQLLLLLGGEALEAVVALAGGAGLVLVHAVQDAKDGEADDGDLAAQVDAVTRVVLGGIGRLVGPAASEVSG